MAPKVYTKYGDEGETGLLYGGRVSKSDPRTEAYGIVDEAVSVIGLGRAHSEDERVCEVALKLQRELFTVGAELATDVSKFDTFTKHFTPVTAAMIEDLEKTIDDLDDSVQLPPAFIIPGASPASAAFDVARSTLRTAERRVVGLREKGQMRETSEVLRYLNRAADLLFMLARYQDRDLSADLLTGDA
jgi:cob(I)alamin adenosyltransferase